MAGPLLGFLLGNVGKVAGANAQIQQDKQQREQLLQQLQQSGQDPTGQQALLLQNGQQLSPQLFAQQNAAQQPQQQPNLQPKVVPDNTSPTGFMFSAFNPQTGQFQSTGQAAPKPGALVSINNAKPLGADITKFVGPDGQTLTDPTLTPSAVIAGGGQAKTQEQLKAEERVGTESGNMKVLDAQLQRAQTLYNKAQEAFERDPTDLKKQRQLQNAAAALQTAIAGRENFRGEPSEGVAGRFNVPGPLRSILENLGGSEEEPNVIDFNDLPE